MAMQESRCGPHCVSKQANSPEMQPKKKKSRGSEELWRVRVNCFQCRLAKLMKAEDYVGKGDRVWR